MQKSVVNVLIVGSAPTVNDYLNDITQFDGDIWALNDAWFWLEHNSVQVKKAFFTDTRFVQKSYKKILHSKCRDLITIDRVDIRLIQTLQTHISVFRSLGAIGCSSNYGAVFHGCSVFFSAMQTAIALNCRNITVCGVLLPMPGQYVRIDGTKTFPEYVHITQLKTARITLQRIRQLGLNLNILEPESNLNFL